MNTTATTATTATTKKRRSFFEAFKDAAKNTFRLVVALPCLMFLYAGLALQVVVSVACLAFFLFWLWRWINIGAWFLGF